MVAPLTPGWQPTKIRRVVQCLDTGSDAVEVMTDAGPAFAKFLGNREGPHVLACEFVGTELAALLGLPVFDHALLPYDGVPEIALASGRRAEPGPAWITRREEGIRWSSQEDDLRDLDNPADIALLVLLDLWTLNCDRYRPEPPPPRSNPSNVFLSREGAPEGKLRLVAMDHTHILTCGRELTSRLDTIDRVQDNRRHGLFPGFVKAVTWDRALAARARLEAVDPAKVREIVAAIPREWSVESPVRSSLERFLEQRRNWLLQAFPGLVFDQPELFASSSTP